jgi:aspartate/methionine/tyrosine aminotransferase
MTVEQPKSRQFFSENNRRCGNPRATTPAEFVDPPHRNRIAVNYAPAAFVVPSRIRSIADLAEHHPNTLRLFYGEDSLPTPAFIKDAAHRAIDGDLTFYTPNAGYPALRRAIAGQVARLHGVDLDPMAEVVVTASGMVALLLGCQATLGAGDSAVVLTPLWPNVAEAVRLAGARAI